MIENPELHPEAQAEYEAHLLYYARHQFSLTTLESFRAEIEDSFRQIATHPVAYRLVKKSGLQRRYGPTKKFRFVIYYVIKPDDQRPTILAIAHPSRNPDYWVRRV